MSDTIMISSGVVSSGLMITSGEVLDVLSGGEITSTTVNAGGIVYVLTGGIGTGTVLSGGSEAVYGTVSDTTVASGGQESVFSGGVTSGGSILSGGFEYISTGGSASDATIDGGELVQGNGGAEDNVTFMGSGGVFGLSGSEPSNGVGTITGFGPTDTIDLSSVLYQGGNIEYAAFTPSFDPLIGTVEVLENDDNGLDEYTEVFSAVLSGDYRSSEFVTTESDQIDYGSYTTFLTVSSGGSDVPQNGTIYVLSGQVASGLSISADALDVFPGGTSIDASTGIFGGGPVSVFSGGVAISTTIGEAGTETIFSGGTTTGDNFGPESTQTVDGTAIGTTGAPDMLQYVAGIVSATDLDGADQFVESAGTAIGTTVSGKQDYFFGSGIESSTETVYSGGVTSGTFLISGVERDAGTAIGTTASGFSDLDIVAGGTAVSAVIYSGSFENISAGGVASGTILSGGGVLSVGGTSASPAVASATIIAGGTMVVGSYGAASAGIAFSGSGGVLEISGGTVSAAISGFAPTDEIDIATLPYTSSASASLDSATNVLTVTAGGSSLALQLSGGYAGSGFVVTADSGSGSIVTGIQTITVSAGEISGGLVIGRDDVLNVLSGGEVISTTVEAGGTVTVFNGAVTTGTVLSGGTESVYGTAVSTVVGSGAQETVFSGGVTSGSLVVGGREYVSSGGGADATLVGGSSGGTLDVFSGGTTSAAVVAMSSAESLSGGVSIGTVVDSGGTEIVGTNAGYVYDDPLIVASDTMIDGGAVIVEGDGTLADGVSFIGSGGFLVVSTYAVPTTVSGFGPTNDVDFLDLAIRNPTSITLDSATDVLTVSAAGQFPYTIPLSGDYASAVFGLNVSGQIDGNGVTVESNPSVLNSAPCFAAGTRIATERGMIAVEHLTIGDRVTTSEGDTKPIAWIGSRRIDCRRHPEPHKVQPVLITAHAFGRGAPSRDLLLSPDHAVFAESVLIPVKHLIDGITIRQVVIPAVTYFHVELHRHDVILAEGLAVESYLDTGDRSAFDDAGGPTVLHPAFASERGDISFITEALGFAPLRVTGPEVEAVRARLRRYPLPARRAAAAPG